MSSTRHKIEGLVRQLKDEDEVVRENSAYVLGEIGAEARELARNTLKKDKNLREMNALIISELREKVIKQLIEALFDKDAWVRGNASDALGKIRAESAIEPLIACLNDKEKVVRYSAAEALGSISNKKAVEPLIKLLSDEDWSIRTNAVVALGELGDPKALSTLKKMLSDSQKDVQVVAKNAIRQITNDDSDDEEIQSKAEKPISNRNLV